MLSVPVVGEATMQVSVRRLAVYPLCAARFSQSRGTFLSPVLRCLAPSTRTLFSETGVWEKDYRTETRRRVEKWWHSRIMAQWKKDAQDEVRGALVCLCVLQTVFRLISSWQKVFAALYLHSRNSYLLFLAWHFAELYLELATKLGLFLKHRWLCHKLNNIHQKYTCIWSIRVVTHTTRRWDVFFLHCSFIYHYID